MLKNGQTAAVTCRLCASPGRARQLFSKGEKKLMKCGACGVIFLEPQAVPEVIATLLSDENIKNDAQLEFGYQDSREPILSRVADQIHKRKPRGRILDIGCASGHFLSRHFSSEQWERFAIEPSKFAAARASSQGIKVFQGQVLSVDLPANHFDVITALDVISFFQEPQRELAILRKALKPDGLFVIAQPRGSSHVWRHTTRLGRLLGGSPVAIPDRFQCFLYDVPSVSLLLEQTSFRLIHLEQLPVNRQPTFLRDLVFRTYHSASRVCWVVSGARLRLGTNFLYLSSPGPLS